MIFYFKNKSNSYFSFLLQTILSISLLLGVPNKLTFNKTISPRLSSLSYPLVTLEFLEMFSQPFDINKNGSSYTPSDTIVSSGICL